MLPKICNVVAKLFRRECELVGVDRNGNSYYISKGKRSVIYNSNVRDPTTISPEWHIWLHYTDSIVPVSSNKKRRIPNLTGTKDAYYPNQKVKSYYKSWNPDDLRC